MHFKSDNATIEKTEQQHNDVALTNINDTSTSCSNSSTDSGVIIIDNKTQYNSNSTCNININNNTNNNNDIIDINIEDNENLNNNIDNSKIHKANLEVNINNIPNLNISNINNANDNQFSIKQSCHNTHINNEQKISSPAISIRSTSISIVSIDENAIDSSVVDSDSEIDADNDGMNGDYIVKKLGQQTIYQPDSPHLPNINQGLTVVGQTINSNENLLNVNTTRSPLTQTTSTTHQIGSIALTNSTDVTFGDKHFYEGPVTIQQFLIDSRDKRKPHEHDGLDNPVYADERKTKDIAQDLGSDQPTQTYKFISNRKAVIITGAIIILTILIGILIVATNTLFKTSIRKSKLLGNGDDSRKNIPYSSTLDKDNIGGGRILRIVARDAWLAQPPSHSLVPLQLPVHRVIVIATQTDICISQATCTYRVRFIQTYNIESLQYDDIIYNFLIGGDGNVYEGRGFDYKGEHLKGFNDDSLSFAYIGTFRHRTPTDKQMNATRLLIDEAIRIGKLSPDYQLIGANTLDPTSIETSADALYQSFKGWPHWLE